MHACLLQNTPKNVKCILNCSSGEFSSRSYEKQLSLGLISSVLGSEMWLFAVYLWVCIFEIADEYLGLSESVRVWDQVEGLSWPVDYPSLNERRLQRGEVDGVNAWMMDWRIGWVERCRVGAYTWEGHLIERKFEKNKTKPKLCHVTESNSLPSAVR